MVVLPNGYVVAQARVERLGAEAIRIIAMAIRAAQRSGKSEGRRTEGCMKSPGFLVVSRITFHDVRYDRSGGIRHWCRRFWHENMRPGCERNLGHSI
jgi:hypothetical protein